MCHYSQDIHMYALFPFVWSRSTGSNIVDKKVAAKTIHSVKKAENEKIIQRKRKTHTHTQFHTRETKENWINDQIRSSIHIHMNLLFMIYIYIYLFKMLNNMKEEIMRYFIERNSVFQLLSQLYIHLHTLNDKLTSFVQMYFIILYSFILILLLHCSTHTHHCFNYWRFKIIVNIT